VEKKRKKREKIKATAEQSIDKLTIKRQAICRKRGRVQGRERKGCQPFLSLPCKKNIIKLCFYHVKQERVFNFTFYVLYFTFCLFAV
jgi:hypothetical protein